VAERDALALGVLPADSLTEIPESDAEYFLSGEDTEIPRFLIPDKRFESSVGGSSRGYAKKARAGGSWFKLSAGAFNAQAEAVASRLARYTNVGECVDYVMCDVNGEYATRSQDFLTGAVFETVKSLHAKVTGTPIESVSEALSGDSLFRYVANIVKRGIGFDLLEPVRFRKLSLLLQFDALVLNEDRHFGNILFVKRAGGWDLAPAFDFDCSLFSCVEDLSEVSDYRRPSLPFYRTHDEQLRWLQSLSDDRLVLRAFNVEDLTRGVWDFKHAIGKREVTRYLQTFQESGVPKQ
jgi:hypothetical protein